MTDKKLMLQTLDRLRDNGFTDLNELLKDHSPERIKRIRNLLWRNGFVRLQTGRHFEVEITTEGYFVDKNNLTKDGIFITDYNKILTRITYLGAIVATIEIIRALYDLFNWICPFAQ